MANFVTFPPEINSLLMFSGAGPAPMLNAAAAWEGLASELGTAASSFSAVTTDLAGTWWQGAASAAMAAAAAPYSEFLTTACAEAAGAAAQARSVAGVFEAARAATIHPLAVAANRNDFVQLIRSNWLGLNAPAIMAAEGRYEQMWAADVEAMAGYYAGASVTAATETSGSETSVSVTAATADGHGVSGFLNTGTANSGILSLGQLVMKLG